MPVDVLRQRLLFLPLRHGLHGTLEEERVRNAGPNFNPSMSTESNKRKLDRQNRAGSVAWEKNFDKPKFVEIHRILIAETEPLLLKVR